MDVLGEGVRGEAPNGRRTSLDGRLRRSRQPVSTRRQEPASSRGRPCPSWCWGHQPALLDARDGYGYQWWTTSVDAHPSFVAAGAGGQFIQVIPDLDLVVVITTDTDQDRSDPQLLIEGTIVSAITH
jgi:CubicO group peptidase (beta-lactamase class C family)